MLMLNLVAFIETLRTRPGYPDVSVILEED